MSHLALVSMPLSTRELHTKEIGGKRNRFPPTHSIQSMTLYFLFRARSISTAIDTVAPTIGLLPIPRKPIIST